MLAYLLILQAASGMIVLGHYSFLNLAGQRLHGGTLVEPSDIREQSITRWHICVCSTHDEIMLLHLQRYLTPL